MPQLSNEQEQWAMISAHTALLRVMFKRMSADCGDDWEAFRDAVWDEMADFSNEGGVVGERTEEFVSQFLDSISPLPSF